MKKLLAASLLGASSWSVLAVAACPIQNSNVVVVACGDTTADEVRRAYNDVLSKQRSKVYVDEDPKLSTTDNPLVCKATILTGGLTASTKKETVWVTIFRLRHKDGTEQLEFCEPADI